MDMAEPASDSRASLSRASHVCSRVMGLPPHGSVLLVYATAADFDICMQLPIDASHNLSGFK